LTTARQSINQSINQSIDIWLINGYVSVTNNTSSMNVFIYPCKLLKCH